MPYRVRSLSLFLACLTLKSVRRSRVALYVKGGTFRILKVLRVVCTRPVGEMTIRSTNLFSLKRSRGGTWLVWVGRRLGQLAPYCKPQRVGPACSMRARQVCLRKVPQLWQVLQTLVPPVILYRVRTDRMVMLELTMPTLHPVTTQVTALLLFVPM